MTDREIHISINGTDHNLIKVAKDDIKSILDANPVLKEVKKMNDKGWEVYDNEVPVSNYVHLYVYFLRKKVE